MYEYGSDFIYVLIDLDFPSWQLSLENVYVLLMQIITLLLR